MNLAMDLIREALLGGSGGGGGGGGMTKVFEKTYTVSTSSTSETVIDSIEIDLEPGVWYYCRVVDTAGKRNDYLLGGEYFLCHIVYSAGQTFNNRVIGNTTAITNTGAPYFSTSTTYGVYPKSAGSNNWSICSKYNSNYTHNIDGDYKVTIFRINELVTLLSET